MKLPHLEDVDDAGEAALRADREIEDDRGGVEAVADGLDGEVEIRAQLVHLVDEADARDAVLVRLAPHRLRQLFGQGRDQSERPASVSCQPVPLHPYWPLRPERVPPPSGPPKSLIR